MTTSTDTSAAATPSTTASVSPMVNPTQRGQGRERVPLDGVRWYGRWLWRHRRWTLASLGLVALVWLSDSTPVSLVLAVLLAVAPGVVCTIWHGMDPRGYESACAGPARRLGWRLRIRREWADIADDCGLVKHSTQHRRRGGKTVTVEVLSIPRLKRVGVSGHTMRLTVRSRPGQTLEDLEAGASRIAPTVGAHTFRTWPAPTAAGSTLVVELVMSEALASPWTAREPEPRVVTDAVRLGRTQNGGDWTLPVRGRHTLCAGATGSGKGSVLWGICCGLSPAVRADYVRLWGIDLKRGVELAMGKGLFSALAYTPEQAIEVLEALLRVIDQRGASMAGRTRLHEPMMGDPLHVLVIDELAALTAYAPPELRRKAERLLSEILTQGRALGVSVVAFVQDPRKEVVGMRGLFSQTIALRLRSVNETAMVLGDGMTKVAPAHRINPQNPGTGWIVEDTGAVDRVRADFWTDDTIGDLAHRYRTGVLIDTTPSEPHGSKESAEAKVDAVVASLTQRQRERAHQRTERKRSPRKPRNRRSPDDGTANGVNGLSDAGEAS